MSRARTFQEPRISRSRVRSPSTSGGSRRSTGRLAKSCRCDESLTARQPGCAGRSITSRKPKVQMRCCRLRWPRESSASERTQVTLLPFTRLVVGADPGVDGYLSQLNPPAPLAHLSQQICHRLLYQIDYCLTRTAQVKQEHQSLRQSQWPGRCDRRSFVAAYLIGENDAASRIFVSCLRTGLSPGGGQRPSAVAFFRTAMRSSRLL